MKYASLSILLLATTGSVEAGNGINAATLVDFPGKVINGIRRKINFTNLMGSPTRPTNSASHSPYEKIMGHPVFQVTTAWGSAYMNMEKVGNDEAPDIDKDVLADDAEDATGVGNEENVYRQISLYYMDPEDAVGAHAEFKQMEGMRDGDVRITSVSLAKALRCASHMGRGLLTGQPINAHKGTVLPQREGGSLRHKIMPPKKQIYYAARCYGRERIGLFGTGEDEKSEQDSREEQAVSAVVGNQALAYRNAVRTQAIADRKIAYKPKNQLEADYEHMDGKLGIPVFYAPGMERRRSRIKSLISGAHRKEIPLFFNYEDLQDAWQKTRPLSGDKDKGLPMEAPNVEVFNLWDVLTSMDKEQEKKRQAMTAMRPQDRLLKAISHPFLQRWKNVGPESASSSTAEQDDVLDSLVFIPSSDACTYKEKLSAQGSAQCRLKPMR